MDPETGSALLFLDETIYSVEVALKAAYWLADRAHVHVSRVKDLGLTAQIRGVDGQDLDQLCGEYCNGLVDFALRDHVARQTAPLHQAIMSQAFTFMGGRTQGR